MTKLLNEINFFGYVIDWNSNKTAIILIIIQAIFVIIAISLLMYLILRRRLQRKITRDTAETVAQPIEQPAPEVVYVTEPKAEVKRELTGISLDLGVVQREFTVGDDFSCDGLIIKAEYNLSPLSESLVDYTLIDSDAYIRMKKDEAARGVYVIRPNMDTAGKKVVTIKYEGQSAAYTIKLSKREPIIETPVVVEQPVVEEQPVKPVEVETVIVEEESVEAGRLRYDKSFEARVIQADDDVKHWYTEIKNTLLSYKTCKGRVSWKRETFKANKQVVAMLVFRGKRLCLFLALNPAEYVDEKYDTETVSEPIYSNTPVMIRLRNEKRVRIAKELIEIMMTQKKVVPNPYYDSQDFYVPYEGLVELINKGLIKREIKSAEQEAIFDSDKKE